MKKGAVPLLTENLFVIGNDALHHQTVYGLEGDNILLTNPEEKVSIDLAFNWVSTPAFMIIPEDHVLSRKLTPEELNVLAN